MVNLEHLINNIDEKINIIYLINDYLYNNIILIINKNLYNNIINKLKNDYDIKNENINNIEDVINFINIPKIIETNSNLSKIYNN